MIKAVNKYSFTCTIMRRKLWRHPTIPLTYWKTVVERCEINNILLNFYFPQSVLDFLECKDPNLKENLIKFKADITYLTDLLKKFIYINLQLQENRLNLMKTKGVTSTFLENWYLWSKILVCANSPSLQTFHRQNVFMRIFRHTLNI